MTIEAIDPGSGERLQSYDEISIADAHQAVEAAHEAFLEWRRTSLSSRAALTRAVEVIPEESGWNALARLYLAIAEIHG